MSTTGVKLFVGNLPRSTKIDELKNLFEKYGKVLDATIVDEYGFVHMKERSNALAAIAGLKSTVWNNSILRVEFSTNRVRLRDDLGKQKSFRTNSNTVETTSRCVVVAEKKEKNENNDGIELTLELEEGETIDEEEDVNKADQSPQNRARSPISRSRSKSRSRSRSPIDSKPNRRRVEYRRDNIQSRYTHRDERISTDIERFRRPSPLSVRDVVRPRVRIYNDRKTSDYYRQPFHANAHFDSNSRRGSYNPHQVSYPPHPYYNSMPPQRTERY